MNYTRSHQSEKTRSLYTSPKKTSPKKKITKKLIQKCKIYSASGQAPAPSKDFYELVVYNDGVVWRKWRICYTKNGKVIPSEERFTKDEYIDSDVSQSDVERYLGDDVLHMSLGYLTGTWLLMLPIHILAKITSHLQPRDICNLQQVSTVANKRYRQNEIWKYPLLEDFGINFDLITDRMKRAKKCYIEEVKKKKENEIDWNNV